MTIWARVKTALTSLSIPMAANTMVTCTGTQLPDTNLVYQLISSPQEQAADDRETLRSYRMQVSYYSRAGLTNLPDISGAMVAAGFTRGPIRELPYNPTTRHFGLAMEFVFLEES